MKMEKKNSRFGLSLANPRFQIVVVRKTVRRQIKLFCRPASQLIHKTFIRHPDLKNDLAEIIKTKIRELK